MLTFASKYEKFWKWFQSNQDEIFNFEADQERVFEKLAVRLQRINRNLTFEFSSISNGKREFVISAAGIKDAFPEVSALVRGAPALSRWEVIAFRQRKDTPQIQCGNKKLDRDSVFFDYVRHGGKIDLTVFLPGVANGTRDDITGLKTIGYLLLDSVVGEYDVETKIAGIEFVDESAFAGRRRMPLRDLPKVIDALAANVQ